jgi:hypothetical protein
VEARNPPRKGTPAMELSEIIADYRIAEDGPAW